MPIPRWLLLAHQLPTRPSNARVKIWRRLQQIGALPTRNSVYVLPNQEQAHEDFDWLRAEIVALGGQATVFAADALNRDGTDDIVSAFQQDRDTAYRALTREAKVLLASAKRRPRRDPALHDNASRDVRGLRERLTHIERIDFFGAPARTEAVRAIGALERGVLQRRAKDQPGSTAVPAASLADYQGRRWVTRPRPGVDRMASAWLIHRYIDPAARFAFVEEPTSADVAFDMYVGLFGHRGSLCTFEVLARAFDLKDLSIVRIGQIVHDLDLKETRYAAPETPTVGRMVEGFQRAHADDHQLLEQGMGLFEGLARSFDPARRDDIGPAAPKKSAIKRRRKASS